MLFLFCCLFLLCAFRSIWFSCDECGAVWASRASFYRVILLYDPCANKLNIFYVRNDLSRLPMLLLPFFSQPEPGETNDYSPPSVNLKQTSGSISFRFPTEWQRTNQNQRKFEVAKTAEYTPTYHTVATVVAPLSSAELVKCWGLTDSWMLSHYWLKLASTWWCHFTWCGFTGKK